MRTLSLVAAQALRIRRQQEIIETQQQAMERMGQTLGRLRSDVELLGAAIPRDKRDLALSLVRDRHRIADVTLADAAHHRRVAETERRREVMRDALAEVWSGASYLDADCVLDHLSDLGASLSVPDA